MGIDAACQYLRAGKLNGAIVAAAQLWMSPEYNEELGTMRAAFSPTGRCHSFDAKADGYCRAEAVNAVYLKRLSDALRDGDPIRAVIRGTANNSNGRTPGIHSPNAEAQAAAIRAAYADAGIDSTQYAETGYMECHATGTPAGDPSEAKASASVLAHMRAPSDSLIIGTIKSNLGHAEPGAGISGLLKAMMVVERGIIPGNPTFVTPNPSIDFEALRIRVSRRSIKWPSSTKDYRRASVASSGFGGSNAHVVLDNAEHYIQRNTFAAQSKTKSYTTSYAQTGDVLSLLANSSFGGGFSSDAPSPIPNVLVFSAHDADSLKRQIEALSAHVVDPRVAIKLCDLSYTLSERRSRHLHRAFIVSRPEYGGNIENLRMDSAVYAKKPPTPARIGFVFTGQGAQWSEMGADLIRLFPQTAKVMVEELDAVLQELPASVRPSWSLLAELTEPRSSEHLRKPEFSQPLVTALQLALLAVLESWNVEADVVVGHSSGEIAAAVSAGLLTPAQAILAAYFRGQAAKAVTMETPMGMLAVGLGPDSVQGYLESASLAGKVVIACYNSPASVTLSGPTSILSELAQMIRVDGHFARLLQVELPYHSHYMCEIGDRYENLLLHYGQLGQTRGEAGIRKTRMVSSVSTAVLAGSDSCSAAYWKANMVSAVQFEGACKRIVQDQHLAPNLIIEIGPSATLGGPIGQIIRHTGMETVSYTSASQRGADTILALFAVAGHLFLHDSAISLLRVNADESVVSETKPAVIIDLPNYKWNHSTQYWHESLASKDWRYRRFPEHDLLGGKVLGTAWESPSWTKSLRLEDLPWLRDHKIGSEIVFPAAGYIAMAVEAVRQTTISRAIAQNKPLPTSQGHHYYLQDVCFKQGLVLQEELDQTLLLSLAPLSILGVNWWAFKVLSLSYRSSQSSSDSWIEHSNGLVRLALNASEPLPQANPGDYNLPLQDPSDARLWYKAFENAGYAYGSSFQKQKHIECTDGSQRARSTILLDPPLSTWEPQSQYALHPACMDCCIQATLTPLHHGDRASVNTVLLPTGIDRIVLSGDTWGSNEAVSVTASDCSLDSRRKALSSASVYDPRSGGLIIQLKGISMTSIETGGNNFQSYKYTRMEWMPDIYHLDSDDKIRKAIQRPTTSIENHVHDVLDLVAHKRPNLRALEIDLTSGQAHSVWFSGSAANQAVRAAARNFTYASDRPEHVLSAQDLYSQLPPAQASQFVLLPIASTSFVAPLELSKFDLVLVRTSELTTLQSAKLLAANARLLLAEEGTLVLHNTNAAGGMKADQEYLKDSLLQGQFIKARQVTDGLFVAEAGSVDKTPACDRTLVILHLSSSHESSWSTAVTGLLKDKGWLITEYRVEPSRRLTQLPTMATILVMDEVSQPLFAFASKCQLEAIQNIVQQGLNLVWVTQGSQMHVSSPIKAICHGVFRSVRAEKPGIRIVTLDIESTAMGQLATTVEGINATLLEVNAAPSSMPADSEFVERDGLLHISRVRPDPDLNRLTGDDGGDELEPVATRLHSTKATIGLSSGRLGRLDSLHFAELGTRTDRLLGPEQLEVEIFASSVNRDDYTVAMGSGDSNQLGHGGAGIIARIGGSVADLHVGQRVAVFHGGCVTNRVVVSRKAVIPLPETLTLEDAATLPTPFVTAIYTLCYLAQLRHGGRVLIHSAANDVGAACIQLCRRLCCEFYVTVDSDEEQSFLVQEMGLSVGHIFSSTSSTFAKSILDDTQGHGIDVIINSSTSHLLDQGWGLLAPGGVHVRIGQGILDRTSLPMDQFTNNRSICTLNIRAMPLDKLTE